MEAAELLLETLRLRPRLPAEDLARHWSSVDPAGLHALARFEGASMWIMARLSAVRADAVAPPSLVEPLRRDTSGGAARNMLVDATADAVLDFLDGERIPCVLLKGIARRAAGSRFPCGDARTTHDVDLLVRAEDAVRAFDRLVASGYGRISEGVHLTPHHLPALIGPQRVGVELHTSMSHTLPPADAWARANDGRRDALWNGRHVVIPSATELLWHGMAHALQHDAAAWRLRFFQDAATVLAGNQPIEWERVAARLHDGEIDPDRAPLGWLAAAAQLAGVALPPGIENGERRFDVSRALRWRLAVLRRWSDAGFGGRLLEEGTRSMLGAPFEPPNEAWGAWKRTRRQLGALAARAVFGVWRATSRAGG